MTSELDDAIKKSRERLEVEPAEIKENRSAALDVLERYYLVRPQVARVELTLALAVIGLSVAIFGRFTHDPWGNAVADVIYICSVLGLEHIWILRWRFSLYGSFRALDAARYEQEHNAES